MSDIRIGTYRDPSVLREYMVCVPCQMCFHPLVGWLDFKLAVSLLVLQSRDHEMAREWIYKRFVRHTERHAIEAMGM